MLALCVSSCSFILEMQKNAEDSKPSIVPEEIPDLTPPLIQFKMDPLGEALDVDQKDGEIEWEIVDTQSTIQKVEFEVFPRSLCAGAAQTTGTGTNKVQLELSRVGVYSVKVRAEDAAGNQSSWSCSPTLQRRGFTVHTDATGNIVPLAFAQLAGDLIHGSDDGNLGAEVWKTNASTGQTSLLKELVPGYRGSNPYGFVKIGGLVYFLATTPAEGTEIWKTDGTAIGTQLAFELVAGTAATAVGNLIPVSGGFAFGCDLGNGKGRELCWSDGSTYQQFDVYVGANSGFEWGDPVSAGSIVYFQGQTAAVGRELFKSNGTLAGTIVVRDLKGGASNFSTANLFWNGSWLFFLGDDDASVSDEPYVSDGTFANTRLLQNINTSGWMPSHPQNFFNFGADTYFFAAANGSAGYDLYKANTTATGASKVLETDDAYYRILKPVQINATQFVYFSKSASGNGHHLWVSNGTTRTLLRTVWSAAGYYDPFPTQAPVSISGKAFFSLYDPVQGQELWITDGTVGGTISVDLYPGPVSSVPSNFQVAGSGIYFASRGPNQTSQLWYSDGTTGGTRFIANANLSTSGEYNWWDTLPIFAFGKWFIKAYDNGLQSILEIDSIGGNTIHTLGSPACGSPSLAVIKNNLFFADNLGMYSSDGTASGVTTVNSTFELDPNERPVKSLPGGNVLIDTLWDGVLFSDGTPGGTVQIAGTQGIPMVTGNADVLDLGDRKIFSLWDISYSGFLFGSNGSATNILPLDTNASGNDGVTLLRSIGNTGYFVAHDGTNRRLWKTDGSLVGTNSFFSISAGAAAESIESIVFNDQLYLTTAVGATGPGNAGTYGKEIFKSDGTTGGTSLLKDIAPGTAHSNPIFLGTAGGFLIFVANDGSNGAELWKTDGTSDGTVLLKDIRAGAPGSSIQALKMGQTSDFLYFTADNGTHGRELWRTDGTAAGTLLVKDINPTSDSQVQIVGLDSGWVYFSADDGVVGSELWRTQGDSTTTHLVYDFNPRGSSSPKSVFRIGEVLIVIANDGYHGTELIKFVP